VAPQPPCHYLNDPIYAISKRVKRVGVGVALHWPKEIVDFVYDVRRKVEQMGYKKEEYFVRVRPFKVDGVPQLRAEVKKINGRGGIFERVACWSCPPADRSLWCESV